MSDGGGGAAEISGAGEQERPKFHRMTTIVRSDALRHDHAHAGHATRFGTNDLLLWVWAFTYRDTPADLRSGIVEFTPHM